MKKKKFLLILASFLTVSLLHAIPDQMAIKVEGPAFEKRTFTNGAVIFTNRIYTMENIPTEFAGFEFLASDGKITNEGTITPSVNGLIYIIAPTGGVAGWSLVPNSEFYYTDGTQTKASIYQKTATANTPVAIPSVTSFAGATPLAKVIHYANDTISVKGNLIDILAANGENYVFPQNTTFKFPLTIPSCLAGKKYATSLVEYNGVTQVSANQACDIVVATHYNTVNVPGWVYTGDYFAISSVRNYYVYKYQYTTPGAWIDIPQRKTSGTVAPTLVFCDNLTWVNPRTLPGTVITKSLDPKNVYITNPSITILPDGDYLAACTGALRFSGGNAGVTFFLSSDKGKTWQVQSANNGKMSYQNLFVHNGVLYVIGTDGVQGNIIIRKSMDKGVTWTYPTSSSDDGFLLAGQYHSAPVPLVVNDGRIWRGFETNFDGENKKVLVMSAPVNSDLMKASSWTFSNQLSYQTSWISGGGKSFKQWLEGNVVVNRDGKVVNMLRIDEEVYGGVAAMVRVNSSANISFDYTKDIINFPGGGKKFAIRYDPVSDYYWTLSNAEFDEDRTKTHSGIYSGGMPCGLLRNRLVLMYSYDLRNWIIKDTIISSDNPFFHGFQYVDWQFENNDIVAVSRTAFEDTDGLPVRQHDANFFTFHRIENFRINLPNSIIKLPNESANIIKSYKGKIEVFTSNLINIDITIYDYSGKAIYSRFNSTNKIIYTDNWQQGLYLVRANLNGKLYTQKIFIYN
ncbi:MAG: T9SS type A sorting domain-containing protein [Paludibacter sp.]|nr:T9SS type A sorting domain-containing protein [Paludibacter sp.]